LDKFHDARNKIIFIQETHTTPKTEKIWQNEWNNWNIIFSSADSSSRGVATFLPKNMDYEVTETMRCSHGRYVAITLIIDGNSFCLINCYAPSRDNPKEQLKWLSEIQAILLKNEASNIIIGGDLNDYFIPHLDKYRCKPKTTETEYVKAWKTLCDELNLTDIWRTLNPNRRCYTWRQGSSAARLKQSRLDYWLISTHLAYDLYNVDIKPSIRSDHSVIDIDFNKIETPTRGPSYWNFNASLLKDKDYVEKIHICYANALEKYNNIANKGLLWDLVKMEIRSTTICF
jgi:exonuclease III